MRMRRSNVCSHENYFPYVRSRKTTFQPFMRFICVLRVRDETKKLETYTTKKKKLELKKYRYHVCSQACWEFLQTYITLNIDNYCASTWIFLNVLFYWRFYRLSWKQKACMVLRCLILITRKLWNFCLTWVDEGKSVKEFLGYGEIASVLFSYWKQNNCGH